MQSSKILDNKQNGKVGDELKKVIKSGSKISIISAYFTIFAYKELRKELNKIDELRFLFTEPAFVNEEKKVIKMLDKFTTEHKFYNIKHSDNLEDNIEIVLNLIEKLQKENEEVKRLIAHKNEYTKKLEEDLFENAENYVISKQKVKDKIRHYQELQDNYIKKYDEINEGLQAMINVLQELIEESEK